MSVNSIIAIGVYKTQEVPSDHAVLCPLAVGGADAARWCVVVIVPRDREASRKDATYSIFLFECDVVIRKRNSTAAGRFLS